jgi:NADPH:quinone reductase-like Zn-dependent oxidoreductase
MVQHPRNVRGVALAPADRVVPIPADISFEQAAAVMLQGMTAHYLSHSAYPIRKGDEILVHAGAGGVGLLLTQMAKTLGARVTATVSTRGRLRSHLKQVQTKFFSTRKWILRKGSTLLAG